jgi:hypothetical protein
MTTEKKAYSPLMLWEEVYCKNCPKQKSNMGTPHCVPASEGFQRCILAQIALELQLLRKMLHERSQHLSW